MKTMNDYRAALNERDSHDLYSAAWKLGQQKVQYVISALMEQGDRAMAAELIDEVYSLNDCGVPFDDEGVQYDLWVLESNGYEDEAAELRELDWE